MRPPKCPPLPDLRSAIRNKLPAAFSLQGSTISRIYFVSLLHVGASFISLAPIFCENRSALTPLILLFRKKSRSARLFGCKRPHDGSQSLPTFCKLRWFNSHFRKAEKIFFMCLSQKKAQHGRVELSCCAFLLL